MLWVAPIYTQPIWKMHSDDVLLHNLVKPYSPLPEHLRTYRITTQIDANARLMTLDEAAVQAFFRFEAFEKKEANTDLTISIKIDKAKHAYEPRTYLDAQKQTWYYYEDRVAPQIQMELRDLNNRVWFNRSGGVVNYHSTPYRKTQREAANDHTIWQRDQSHWRFIEEAHRQTLQAWSDQLANQFDQKSEVVSFYYPTHSDFDFAKSIRTIGEILLQLNKGVSLDTVAAKLQPYVAGLEQTQTASNLKTQKGWHMYAACALNLAHIYRCLGDYDRVQHYMRQLIEVDYHHAIPQIKHLSELRERNKLYQYFQKNGKNLFEAEQGLSDARFDSLRQRTEVDGYIVLRNGLKLEGAILNPVENFDNLNIKLKYEKKLNAPVADQEYPLEDIEEIYLEGWHLGVLRRQGLMSGAGFFITEILFQSPTVTLHRALPCFGHQYRNGMGQALVFLQREAKKGDYRTNAGHGTNDWLDKSFIKHLKSCNTMLDRLRYGYYTASEALEVAIDYNVFCGGSKAEEAPERPKVRAKSNPSKSPGFYWGINTGMNNFSSVIGLSTTLRLKGKLFLRTGIGTGIWGSRFAAGFKYDLRHDMRYSKGWSFAVGYGYNKGVKGTSPIKGSNTVAGNTKEVDIEIIQKPVSTLNATLIFNRMKKARKCFTVELGYAVSLQKEPWTIVPGGIGAEHSRRYIKLAQPGGLVVGVGINFGR